MEVVIGIGKAGRGIVQNLLDYPQYSFLLFDTGKNEDERIKFYSVPVFSSPEQYEEYASNASFKDLPTNKDCLLIFSGAGTISGMVLALMEKLHNNGCRLFVLLISSEQIAPLSEADKLQEHAVFGILQQYARSGALERVFLVDNSIVETISNATMLDYYSKINEAVASTLHWINCSQHMNPVYGSDSQPSEICRISTFGVCDVSGNESERIFFDLERPESKSYYFYVNERDIANRATLEKLREYVKQNAHCSQMSFCVFSTTAEKIFGFSQINTSFIQGEKLDA